MLLTSNIGLAQTTVFPASGGVYDFEADNPQLSYALVLGTTIGRKSNGYITNATAYRGTGFASIQGNSNGYDGYLFITLDEILPNMSYGISGYAIVGSTVSAIKPANLQAYLVNSTTERPTTSPLSSFYVSETVVGYRPFTIGFTTGASETRKIIAIRLSPATGTGYDNAFLSIDDLSVVQCTAPSFTLPAAVCSNQPPITLQGSQGGSFSSPTAGAVTQTSSNTYQFNPGVLPAGTASASYNVVYTNACGVPLTKSIRVDQAPAFTLQSSICSNAAAITLTGTPSGGTFSGQGVSLVSGSYRFNPAGLAAGSYTITYAPPSGSACSSIDRTINVETAPSFTLPSAICSNAAPITLTGTPSGGTFSGQGVSLVNGSYQFNPAGLATGQSYTITYALTTGAGCSSTPQSIRVDQALTFNLPTNICANASPITLTGTPSGGTFTGTGVTGNTNKGFKFDPSAAGPGPVTITYTVSSSNSACGNSLAKTIQVDQVPAFTLPASICATAAPITLTGTPSGGTFSGTGVSLVSGSYQFNPAGLAAGSYTITYAPPSGSACSSTTRTLQVEAAPSLPAFSAICEGSSLRLTSGTPSGGTYSGTGVTSATRNGVTTYTFNSAGTLAPDTYTINYTTSCGTASNTITITPKPKFNQTFKPVCAGTTLDMAPGVSPSGGTFSGPGVSSAGVFNPALVTGSGPFTITYTTGCGTASINLTVTNTTDWLGTVSNDWYNEANWSACVPSSIISAVIPAPAASAPNPYPVIASGTASVRNLTLRGNWAPSSGNIDLYGDLLIADAGVFNQTSGTVTLRGTNQIIGVATFNNLTSAASGTTQLTGNISVTGVLNMQSGVLNTTSSFQADLGTTGSLVETDNNYVTGRVRATRTIGDSGPQNFGGIGISLSVASGTSPGTVTVDRVSGPGTAQTGVNNSTSVLRYFDLTPAVPPSAPFLLTGTFNYREAELNNIPEANLRAFRSANGSIPWQPLPSTVNAAANQVSFGNMSSMSRITLGNSVQPLPVTLVAFSAQRRNGAVQLNWSTASEKNNRGFGVEVSAQGAAFSEVGFVNSLAGNSSSLQSYLFLDETPRAAGTYFYRLRQVDTDGTTTYSAVRPVVVEAAAQRIKAYPNPYQHAFKVELTAPSEQPVTVRLYNLTGQVVYQTTRQVGAGTHTLDILPPVAPAGVYSLSVQVGNAPAQHLRLVQE